MTDTQSMFMQIIPGYSVVWTDTHGKSSRLECSEDDIQAIVRSVLRTDPTVRIEIKQEHPMGIPS